MKTESPGEAALLLAEAGTRRVEEWSSHLRKLSAGHFPQIAEQSFLGRELRAAATVATMAELESALREMLVSISAHITKANIPVKDLILPLRTLAGHTKFESLASSGDHTRIWENRIFLTQMESSAQTAELPGRIVRGPQPPLDGRTIQLRHISIVWSVLGLNDPIPSASIVASLKKLTQIRNDVAHRNIPIIEVFTEAGRSAYDIAKYLDDIAYLILHVGNEWSEYINRESYLKV